MKLFLVIAVFAVVTTATFADSKHGQHKLQRSKGISKQLNDAEQSSVGESQLDIIDLIMQSVKSIANAYLRFSRWIATHIPVVGTIVEWLLPQDSNYSGKYLGIQIPEDITGGIFGDKDKKTTTPQPATGGDATEGSEPATEGSDPVTEGSESATETPAPVDETPEPEAEGTQPEARARFFRSMF